VNEEGQGERKEEGVGVRSDSEREERASERESARERRETGKGTRERAHARARESACAHKRETWPGLPI